MSISVLLWLPLPQEKRTKKCVKATQSSYQPISCLFFSLLENCQRACKPAGNGQLRGGGTTSEPKSMVFGHSPLHAPVARWTHAPTHSLHAVPLDTVSLHFDPSSSYSPLAPTLTAQSTHAVIPSPSAPPSTPPNPVDLIDPPVSHPLINSTPLPHPLLVAKVRDPFIFLSRLTKPRSASRIGQIILQSRNPRVWSLPIFDTSQSSTVTLGPGPNAFVLRFSPSLYLHALQSRGTRILSSL